MFARIHCVLQAPLSTLNAVQISVREFCVRIFDVWKGAFHYFLEHTGVMPKGKPALWEKAGNVPGEEARTEVLAEVELEETRTGVWERERILAEVKISQMLYY